MSLDARAASETGKYGESGEGHGLSVERSREVEGNLKGSVLRSKVKSNSRNHNDIWERCERGGLSPGRQSRA